MTRIVRSGDPGDVDLVRRADQRLRGTATLCALAYALDVHWALQINERFYFSLLYVVPVVLLLFAVAEAVHVLLELPRRIEREPKEPDFVRLLIRVNLAQAGVAMAFTIMMFEIGVLWLGCAAIWFGCISLIRTRKVMRVIRLWSAS